MDCNLDLLSALAANEREVQEEGDPCCYSLYKDCFALPVVHHIQAKYSQFAKCNTKRLESILFGEGRLEAIKTGVVLK